MLLLHTFPRNSTRSWLALFSCLMHNHYASKQSCPLQHVSRSSTPQPKKSSYLSNTILPTCQVHHQSKLELFDSRTAHCRERNVCYLLPRTNFGDLALIGPLNDINLPLLTLLYCHSISIVEVEALFGLLPDDVHDSKSGSRKEHWNRGSSIRYMSSNSWHICELLGQLLCLADDQLLAGRGANLGLPVFFSAFCPIAIPTSTCHYRKCFHIIYHWGSDDT